jgi:predicted alpha/beta-fold hydrolase
MPVCTACSYQAPPWFPGGHLQTIVPRLLRTDPGVRFQRERLELADGDFLDIDWLLGPGSSGPAAGKAVILSHGLEGDSRRSYMLGMAAGLATAGWDVAARNFRGCGGESNRLLQFYHSGETEDLHAVVQECLARGYTEIALVGFSMGGNQICCYLGRDPGRVPAQVSAAVGISVPCDLACCSAVLARPRSRLYMSYFLRSLRRKMKEKSLRFPGALNLDRLNEIKDFKAFDDRFTAPVFGFRNAEEYWEKASAARFLDGIRVPTLLINAGNDPFMGPGCFPTRAARNRFLHLLIPREGGHVGFPSPSGRHDAWLWRETAAFLG